MSPTQAPQQQQWGGELVHSQTEGTSAPTSTKTSFRGRDAYLTLANLFRSLTDYDFNLEGSLLQTRAKYYPGVASCSTEMLPVHGRAQGCRGVRTVCCFTCPRPRQQAVPCAGSHRETLLAGMLWDLSLVPPTLESHTQHYSRSEAESMRPSSEVTQPGRHETKATSHLL